MAIVQQAKRKHGLLENPIKEYSGYHPLFYDLPTMLDGVVLRLISSGLDGDRIGLCVEIGDDTSITDVKNVWHIVLKYRERLQRLQGLSPYGDNSFYAELLMLNTDYGLSPAKIAKRINEAITKYVVQATAGENDFTRKLARHNAEDVLRLCSPGISDDDRGATIAEAMQRVEANLSAFDDKYNGKYPILGADVRERIRQFKKSKVKTGKVLP